ncbi:unnamed protein product [Zymoseptoria tritici ST99CH_3D7]|uniref:Uncharacterized protein n=1 Tax=Zymoseptoria tritici (strain ST99CH_3D7) TaxID=1276538 RepID=A0A1X7RYK6_ZYMT9|nr:unnamed protein product [Zymoseptoria tritici ST99CH_3D7]
MRWRLTAIGIVDAYMISDHQLTHSSIGSTLHCIPNTGTLPSTCETEVHTWEYIFAPPNGEELLCNTLWSHVQQHATSYDQASFHEPQHSPAMHSRMFSLTKALAPFGEKSWPWRLELIGR